MGKTIVAGSRSFKDYDFMNKILIHEPTITEIFSGDSKGADTLAKKFAKANKIPHTIFSPKWEEYGILASKMRNLEMTNKAERGIIFWDGVSEGTKDIIALLQRQKKPCRVILYQDAVTNTMEEFLI